MDKTTSDTLFQKHDALACRVTVVEKEVALVKDRMQHMDGRIGLVSDSLIELRSEIRNNYKQQDAKLDVLITAFHEQRGVIKVAKWAIGTGLAFFTVMVALAGVILS